MKHRLCLLFINNVTPYVTFYVTASIQGLRAAGCFMCWSFLRRNPMTCQYHVDEKILHSPRRPCRASGVHREEGNTAFSGLLHPMMNHAHIRTCLVEHLVLFRQQALTGR